MYGVQETQSLNESFDEIVLKVSLYILFSSTILLHSSTNLLTMLFLHLQFYNPNISLCHIIYHIHTHDY